MAFNRNPLFVHQLLAGFLCLTGLTFATGKPQGKSPQEITPGSETRIDVNDQGIGGDYFLLYVPSDYTEEHDWPVIFFYQGAGVAPSTQLLRDVTRDKNFIIVAMEYVRGSENKMSVGQYLNYLKRELKSLAAVKRYICKRLKVDKKRMFITGISKGGWLVSVLAERTASAWAGIAIFCAGRNPMIEDTDETTMRGKAIYIGAGEKDQNLTAAKKAAAYYERLGAEVTFEKYKGLGHAIDPNSKKLYDWLLVKSTSADGKSKRTNENN